MARPTKTKRGPNDQAINRLALAITYYREHTPEDPRQRSAVVKSVALRFGVNPKTLQQALQIASGVYINTDRQ